MDSVIFRFVFESSQQQVVDTAHPASCRNFEEGYIFVPNDQVGLIRLLVHILPMCVTGWSKHTVFDILNLINST